MGGLSGGAPELCSAMVARELHAAVAAPELRCVVVVPARDERETIGHCLEALAAQTVGRAIFQVLLVLDGCQDDTEQVAREHARRTGLALRTLLGPGRGTGPARRAGMDEAAQLLLSAGRPEGLIASTDADSRPATDWIERQLAHARAGAEAIAGLIELEPADRAALPDAVRARRRRDATARLERVRRDEPEAEHHHFAGASLAVTAAAYRRVGGIDASESLEDAAFAARLRRHGVEILRAADVRVLTSARRRGRARRGLSVDLDVALWSERRRHRVAEFSAREVAADKGEATVTVVVPTKDCAGTVGGVLRGTVAPLAELGLVDELVVIDAASRDGTAEVAAAGGAVVLQQDELLAEWGPALGKGDALWRATAATGGEIVCFLDGDTLDPRPEHLLGLLGPILRDPGLALVKGAFDRPLRAGEVVMPHEGGRVTELMARPLLNLHEPRLAAFAQPLAGEFAARRDLLEEISFPVGYGVEIALLIDALHRRGLDALAECHLGTRQNRHQPLRALGEMAYAVLVAVERRKGGSPGAGDAAPGGAPRGATPGGYLRPWEDGLVVEVPVAERPPLVTLRVPAGAPS